MKIQSIDELAQALRLLATSAQGNINNATEVVHMAASTIGAIKADLNRVFRVVVAARDFMELILDEPNETIMSEVHNNSPLKIAFDSLAGELVDLDDEIKRRENSQMGTGKAGHRQTIH